LGLWEHLYLDTHIFWNPNVLVTHTQNTLPSNILDILNLIFQRSHGGRSAPGASRPVALAAACGAAAHAAGRPQGRARVERGPTGAVDGTAQNCRSLGKTAWIEW